MTKAAELVRAFYAAVARADVPGVVALLHPNLHWTEAEGFPYYSGTWRHPQDVVDKLLVPLMRDWDNFSAVADDLIVEGDRVVSLGTYAGVNKATGKAMRAVEADPRAALSLRFSHDGTERSGRADPPEGHAGDPDDGGGARRLDARALG
jgi:ketosteroid isomerase-like protein